jgi:hypothetical protein
LYFLLHPASEYADRTCQLGGLGSVCRPVPQEEAQQDTDNIEWE